MVAGIHRIKVVNDVSDLVPILRAVDSPVKLKLVQRLGESWLTLEDVIGEFGKEGEKALAFFEKLRLIDTRWVAREGRKQPDKSYHFYYSTTSTIRPSTSARPRPSRRSPRSSRSR
jgi:predicted DNA-binding ArsR family transcriptional regulator